MSKVEILNIKFNKTVDCVTGKDNKCIQFKSGEVYALVDEPKNWPLRWLKRGHVLMETGVDALSDPRFLVNEVSAEDKAKKDAEDKAKKDAASKKGNKSKVVK